MEEKKTVQLDPKDSEAVARYAVSVLDSKKALGLKLLHVEDRTVIADDFVIATGTSRTHVKTLADETEYQLGEAGVPLHHREGMESGWVLLDFGNVIVHIFSADAREFYKLDKLYADTTETDISDLVSANG